MMHIAVLADRGVVAVSGADRVPFLQGLVSNDVAAVAPGRAVWAALLSPQGKYQADFFILAADGTLLLDCASAQVPLLVAKLNRFRLRADAAVADVSAAWIVGVGWGDMGTVPIPDGVIAPDPRLEGAGWRMLSGAALPANSDAAAWDRHRLALGLPDGVRDLEPDKSVLLEAGFDELNGVSWSKGCYMGQELTARTKYRGLIKRRLVPVAVSGTLPPLGAPVLAEGREVGTLRSGQGAVALASLRLDAFALPLTCEDAVLVVRPPAWMRLPA